MTSDDVFDAIEQIAATPGKKDKEALVAALLKDPLGKQVLVACYDPFVTYGIAKVPDRTSPSPDGCGIGHDGFMLLEDMAKRYVTGNLMKARVEDYINDMSARSAELFRRILTKDMRAGFTDGTINRVAPGTVVEFAYMRCSLPKDAKFDKFQWAKGCFSQVKADGMFANLNTYSDGTVSLHSRQGTPFPVGHPDLEELYNWASNTLSPGTQSHGELLVQDAMGKTLPRQIGNGMLNKVAQGGRLEEGHRITYSIWDQIPLTVAVPKGKCDTPYVDRLTAIIHQLKAKPSGIPISLIETRVVGSLREAYKHSAECTRRGLEGTIIKNRTATWKDSTSKEQIKLKLEVEVDLKITGFTEGKGKNASTFGAISCATSDDLLKVDAGTGITDKMREEINARREELLGSVITIKINDVLYPSASNDFHSAFLPVVIELRNDKTIADSLQRVIEQVEAAKQGEVALKEAA